MQTPRWAGAKVNLVRTSNRNHTRPHLFVLYESAILYLHILLRHANELRRTRFGTDHFQLHCCLLSRSKLELGQPLQQVRRINNIMKLSSLGLTGGNYFQLNWNGDVQLERFWHLSQ